MWARTATVLCVLVCSSLRHTATTLKTFRIRKRCFILAITSSTSANSFLKIHSTFLQSYLQPWLEFVAATVEHSASSLLLLKNSFTAGIETIFNFDILRTTQDNKSESLLFDAFRSLKPTSRNVVLQTLPRIFEAYILAIRKYRNTLFSHGSNQVAGAAALDELHTAGMHFFALCQGLLEEEGPDKLCWEIRDALLVLVERENLFHKKQLTAESVLNRNIELSLQALDLMSKGECLVLLLK